MIKDTINQLLDAHFTQDGQKLLLLTHLISEEHQRLQDRITYLERQLYGKKREHEIPSLVMESLPLFDAQENDEIAVYSEGSSINYQRKKDLRKRRKRLELSSLPKREIIHDLPEVEQYCDECRHPIHKFSEDRATKVEMIPTQYIAVEHILVNYACRHCGQVKRAKKKPSAIAKSLAGNSLIAKVIVDKYMHHLPNYRQSMMYRQHGFVVADQTIGHWTTQLAESLDLLQAALWTQITRAPYLQVDETPVLCLEQKKKCYMWSYAAFYEDKKPSFVLFDFQITRGSASVNERLMNFKGILQTDGYAGYNALRTKPGVIGLGCGAHIRRKFFDVASASHGPFAAAEKAIHYFKQLYTIESMCKEMSFEERRIYRQIKAKPIIDEFHLWLKQIVSSVPPKSTLYRAIHYALDEWPAWSQYINYGQAEIDTNWVENQIRPFAVGRRNWLFVGNQRGGETSALLYSLTHSAKLNSMDPWKYLFYLSSQVHSLRQKQIDPEDLLPHRVNVDAVNELANQHFYEMMSLCRLSPS